MALRITLWALLLGTLVLGYFGLQAGSATTTLVGALVLAFILFLLYFLAKNLLGFGVIAFKFVLIIVLIFFLGVALFKGCSLVFDKTVSATHAVSQNLSEQKKQVFDWYDNGNMKGSAVSLWDKFKGMFSFSKSKTIPPSTSLPIPSSFEQGKNKGIHLSGIVKEVFSGYLFRINGHFIKLYAIDSPDINQMCIDRQASVYPCGKMAKNKLKQLIFNKHVDCILLDTDGMNNYVATCKIGDYDVGAVMVVSGWAVANRESASVYIPYENEAQARKKGLWEGKFMAPWKFRRLDSFNHIIGRQ